MTTSHTPPAEKLRILVVDDDDLVSGALRRVLQAAGYDVTVARDGKSGAAAVASSPFDVILSDIQMPGMSGIDFLGAVRGHDLDVPVVLMTGNPSLETAMKAVSLGALQYLVKPVDNEEIRKTVDRASRLHRLAKAKRDAMRLLGLDAEQAGDRAGLEASFDGALSTMWMAFQPIVDAQTRKVFGYEALMRSKEPALPHPGAVLEAAERLHRLPDVGRRVRQLSAEAFAKAPEDALLFVNLHTLDLLDPALYELGAPLTQFAPRVVLEITERSTIDGVKDIQSRMAMLRERGFRIAVDDLGAGYAGLSSFAALQPEIVKLDMSLVRGIHESAVKQRVVASMTSLCKEMGLLVVSEGIEIPPEHETVKRLGCTLLQGYLFAKPGPPFPTVNLA